MGLTGANTGGSTGGEAALTACAGGFDAFPLLRDLQPALAAELAREASPIRLRGGEVLCRQGDPADALFLVVHGSLEIVVQTAENERVVSILGRGASVGEMALLSGEPRSATVRALRDCALLRVPAAMFHSLLERQPGLAAGLARLLAGRLRETSLVPRVVRSVRTVGVIPAGGEAVPEAFVAALATALAASSRAHGGAGVRRLDGAAVAAWGAEPDEHRFADWLNAQEDAHAFVLYVCDATLTPWTRRALRQLDVLLCVGSGRGDPAPGEIEQAIAERPELTRARRELVLLHAAGDAPSGTRRWLGRRAVAAHHHLRRDGTADIARLARALAGRSVGVVLSGGGARGFVHLGVVRALRERGIAIDQLAGSSMGAVIAAQLALGWDDAELLARNREAFVGITPWSDFTFPAVALLRGRTASRLMQRFFGDIEVADLWLPFFCVSTNLSRARVMVHDQGPVWLWARASCSVPGIGPPVVRDGDLLVDGGVLNNMPVDVMRQRCAGTVIAVDATAEIDLTTRAPDAAGPLAGEMSGWPHLLRRLSPWSRAEKFPSVFAILLRTAAMSSAATMGQMAAEADLTVRPPTGGLHPLDWSGVDSAAELGYRHAVEQLAGWQGVTR